MAASRVRSRSEIVIGLGVALLLVLTLFAVIAGATGFTPKEDIRPIAKFYLYYAINWYEKKFWAASPEAVNSMVWDYRGYDTLYETSVFFLAIIGAIAVFRIPGVKDVFSKGILSGRGLSLIVKTITKLVIAFVLIVSIAIAVHGNLTPGGGFQAGSAISITTLLAIAVFSRIFLEERKITTKLMLPIRVLGVLGIGLLALGPALIALSGIMSFVIQNQPKPWANWGFTPGIGPFWFSGNQFFYNFFEFIAVGAGFTVIYLVFSIPELIYKRVLKK